MPYILFVQMDDETSYAREILPLFFKSLQYMQMFGNRTFLQILLCGIVNGFLRMLEHLHAHSTLLFFL